MTASSDAKPSPYAAQYSLNLVYDCAVTFPSSRSCSLDTLLQLPRPFPLQPSAHKQYACIGRDEPLTLLFAAYTRKQATGPRQIAKRSQASIHALG
jgi:hypothetical protein